MTESEEKTRVTAVVQPPRGSSLAGKKNDCLVVIYTKEPTLLGKRFVLEHSPTRVGRGADNHIVLDGDSVSRRHAHFEQRGDGWFVVDDGSTNGTYVNDEQIVARGRRSTTATASRSVRPSSSSSPAPTSRRSTTKRSTG